MLDRMINANQKGFVLGWKIMDIAITSHDIIHSMDWCHLLGMDLKLDISKAYNRVGLFLFEIS